MKVPNDETECIFTRTQSDNNIPHCGARSLCPCPVWRLRHDRDLHKVLILASISPGLCASSALSEGGITRGNMVYGNNVACKNTPETLLPAKGNDGVPQHHTICSFVIK